MENLNNLRELVANGKLENVFEELIEISKSVEDKELRNSILLNCFSYKVAYKDKILNVKENTSEINKIVLATLNFLDEIEENLKSPITEKGINAENKLKNLIPAKELTEKIDSKVDVLIEKYFNDIFIEYGDIDSLINKSGLNINQVETALKVVKENFQFFQKIFYRTPGMTLQNFLDYAIEALYVNEKRWSGILGRKDITKKFKELISSEN